MPLRWTRSFGIGRVAACVLVGMIALLPRAEAQEKRRAAATHTDVWVDLAPGVRYLHRTTTVPSSVHAVVVDMRRPGVRVVATPYEQRWQTVGEYATQNRVVAATNGGFWGMFQRAAGVTAGGGQRWPDGEDDDDIGFFAVTRDGRGWISPPERVENDVPPNRLSEATSGKPMLVRAGTLDQSSLDAFPYSNLRHPRSAVGVSRDGRTIVLVVADGRQGHSRGMTLYELARLFVELGSYEALNLDGGGSSAMWVGAVGGIVNSPSGGRWEARLGIGATSERRAQKNASKVRQLEDGTEEVFVRGIEREVMNHLGVIAPGAASATGPMLDEHGNVDPTRVALPPRQPKLHLGRSREVLYPIFFGAALCLPVIGLGVAFWWRRRKRLRAVAAQVTAPSVPSPSSSTA